MGEYDRILSLVNKIPNLRMSSCNDKEIHLISKSAFLDPDSLNRIKEAIGLRKIGVTWCPCSGYNPMGIVLIGYF